MKLLSLFILLFCAVFSFAQVDTINAKNKTLITAKLKDEKESYLVYFTDSAFNRRGTGDVWERNTRLINFNNKPAVEFVWKWLNGDSLAATVSNICDRSTLAPIHHKADYKKRGTFAYDYRDNKMIPSDSVTNNAALKRNAVELTIPIVSWELDLETFPLLPIKKVGQKFDIAFFDPNEESPSYHRYEVTGKEVLEIADGVKVNCWLLRIEYDKDIYAVFWLAENSKKVLKMKERYKSMYRFKVRLY